MSKDIPVYDHDDSGIGYVEDGTVILTGDHLAEHIDGVIGNESGVVIDTPNTTVNTNKIDDMSVSSGVASRVIR